MTLVLYALGAVGVGASLKKASGRLQLSKAKHPSLRGHARISRLMARLVPFYEYGEQRFFRVDGAPDEVVSLRQAGFQRLADTFASRFAKTRALTREIEDGLSDLQ